MTFYGKSSRWAAAFVLGLACLTAIGAVLVLAAPARTAASAFELTLDVRDTVLFEGDVIIGSERVGTFRSRAPFCETGTFVEDASSWVFEGPFVDEASSWVFERTWRFTCGDGTGSVTVSSPEEWDAALVPRNTIWRILDGTGSYAGLRGRGSLRGEQLGSEISDSRSVVTWRSTLQGSVDWDATAPTMAISSATPTKLRHPAGAYAVRLRIAHRDNVADNPVSYTLRVTSGRGIELARRFGTAGTEPVSMMLRIRPPAGARTVRLELTGEDPIGNTVSARRTLNLPR